MSNITYTIVESIDGRQFIVENEMLKKFEIHADLAAASNFNEAEGLQEHCQREFDKSKAKNDNKEIIQITNCTDNHLKVFQG